MDDNGVDREVVARALAGVADVLEATTAAEAADLLHRSTPDCVLLDDRLPDGRGVALLPEFLEAGVASILLTGQGDESVASEALRLGAHDYLMKRDLDPTMLHRALEQAVERCRLQRTLYLYKEVFRSAPFGIVVRHAGTETEPPVIVDRNPAAERAALAPEALEQRFRAAAERLQEHAEGQGPVALSLPRLGTAGDRIFDIRAAPLSPRLLGLYMEDVTTRVAAERGRDAAQGQMRAAQRLESVGQLAGGIAHDFNNLLMVIGGNAAVIEESGVADPDSAQAIQAIQDATEKAARLTRQLLAFSRKQPQRLEDLRLGDVARGMKRMLPRLLGEDIHCQFELAEDELFVRADESQLEQIVLNLAVNARDAMKGGGRLVIETIVEAPVGDETPWSVLRVRDNGQGMDATTKERCLEPFFTTKPQGEGTGLGLSTVFGIVAQSGGRVHIESEPGQGTTVEIRLPARVGAVGSEWTPSEAARGGSETVLVVEDDDAVRQAIVRQLERLGYRVLTAHNGPSAVQQVLDGRRVDLVVSDVVMPDVNGPQLVAMLEELVPNLRALFVSGYVGPMLDRHDEALNRHDFLRKPFDRDSLGAAVRKRLDRPQPPHDPLGG